MGVRWRGVWRTLALIERQKLSSAARAPSGPARVMPSASATAFIAPAEVPETPAIRSRPSSRM